MPQKRRNPYIPSERAMEMDEKSTVERDESKNRLSQQPDKDAEGDQASANARKNSPSETRDPNQPKMPKK